MQLNKMMRKRKKLRRSNMEKRPKKREERGTGIEDAHGRFQSLHDMLCLQIMGCDVEKLAKALGVAIA